MTEIMPVPRNSILLSYQQGALLLPLIVGYCIKHQKNAVFHKEKYRTVFPDLLVASLQMNTFHSELNHFHNPRRMVYPDQLQFHRSDKYVSFFHPFFLH